MSTTKEIIREQRTQRALAAGRIPGRAGRPKRKRCNAGHDRKENTMAWGECRTCYELAHPKTRGPQEHETKMSKEQQEQIKKLKAQGVPQTEIAQQFGISQPTVSRILAL